MGLHFSIFQKPRPSFFRVLQKNYSLNITLIRLNVTPGCLNITLVSLNIILVSLNVTQGSLNNVLVSLLTVGSQLD